jgi:ribosomal protein L37AE/L43A
MPPIKVCPHCKREYHARRETVCKFPVVVGWVYPMQCPECGAQLDRQAYDRTVDRYQVTLEVDG